MERSWKDRGTCERADGTFVIRRGFGLFYESDRATRDRWNTLRFVHLPIVIGGFLGMFFSLFKAYFGFWSGAVLVVIGSGAVALALERHALRGARRVSKEEWSRCVAKRDGA
jgi:hypothetical protein